MRAPGGTSRPTARRSWRSCGWRRRSRRPGGRRRSVRTSTTGIPAALARPRCGRDHDRDGAGRRGRDQGRDRRRRAGRRRPARGDDHGRVHRRRRLPHALEQGSEGGRALLRAAGGPDRARCSSSAPSSRGSSRSCSRSSRSSSRSHSSRSSARSGRSPSSSSTCSRGWGSRSASTTPSSSSAASAKNARADREARGYRATGRTASRAVLFSGTAFVIAMTRDAARAGHDPAQPRAGAILVGLTAVVAATTLLPAVLSLLGDRVDALRLPLVGRDPARAGSGAPSLSASSGGRSRT